MATAPNGASYDEQQHQDEIKVWTVSQDGGKTVSGAYSGKGAKTKAARESGGKTNGMTYGQFKAAYPTLDVVML